MFQNKDVSHRDCLLPLSYHQYVRRGGLHQDLVTTCPQSSLAVVLAALNGKTVHSRLSWVAPRKTHVLASATGLSSHGMTTNHILICFSHCRDFPSPKKKGISPLTKV